MRNYDHLVKINHTQNWPYIPDHSYRILIIGGSGLGTTNMLLNLIKINDQILTKFIYTSKNHSNQNINWKEERGRKKVGIKKFKNRKIYSQAIDDDYKNSEDYNPTKKRKVLIVFDDVIADMECNKN